MVQISKIKKADNLKLLSGIIPTDELKKMKASELKIKVKEFINKYKSEINTRKIKNVSDLKNKFNEIIKKEEEKKKQEEEEKNKLLSREKHINYVLDAAKNIYMNMGIFVDDEYLTTNEDIYNNYVKIINDKVNYDDNYIKNIKIINNKVDAIINNKLDDLEDYNKLELNRDDLLFLSVYDFGRLLTAIKNTNENYIINYHAYELNQQKLNFIKNIVYSNAINNNVIDDIYKNKIKDYMAGDLNYVRVILDDNFKDTIENINDYIINSNNYYALNSSIDIGKLISVMTGETLPQNFSDTITAGKKLAYFDKIIIEKSKKVKTRRANRAGLFKYYNNIEKLDLSKYGIFKNAEDVPENYYNYSCLYHALKVGGMSENKLNALYNYMNMIYINVKYLGEICKKLDISIKLTAPKEYNLKHNNYGNSSEIYNIGILDDHYFINEKTEYKINMFDSSTKSKNHITSYTLIKRLLQNKDKYLIKINNFNLSENVNKLEKLIIPDVLPSDYKQEEYKERGNNNEVVYFCEMYEYYDNENKDLIPFNFSAYNNEDAYLNYFGLDCVQKILNNMENNIILYFEDANKHYINIRKNENIEVIKEVVNNGVFKYAICTYFKYKKIKILDIKSVIPYKFNEYTNKFNLNYNVKYEEVENLGFNKRVNKTDELIKLSENYKIRVRNDFIKYDDLLKEASYYKCLIMRDSYNKLSSKISAEFGFNLNNYNSFQGIIKDNMLKNGYLNGVYHVSGSVKAFISQSVIGGRVQTLENKKHDINEDVTLLDFNSAYTAGMCVRPDFKGFMLGEPKKLESTDYEIIKNYDMYFVTIKIISVGKYMKNPIISIKRDEGIINTNEAAGEIITVDRYTLEDYILYQEIKFEILGGYYYNNGFTDAYKEEYINIYNKKLETKDILYKLYLVSSYGLFLSKYDDITTRNFKDQKEFDVYMTRNPERIMSYSYINKSSKIIAKLMDVLNKDHYNYAHLGSIILSMAKRINNEILALAEDNNINIYYQSTDSILLKSKDVEKLTKLYKLKYGRDLIGNNLGQMKVEDEGNRAFIAGKNQYIIRHNTDDINNKYRIRWTGASSELIEKLIKSNVDIIDKLKTASEKEGFILLEKSEANYIINRNGEININNNKYIKINV